MALFLLSLLMKMADGRDAKLAPAEKKCDGDIDEERNSVSGTKDELGSVATPSEAATSTISIINQAKLFNDGAQGVSTTPIPLVKRQHGQRDGHPLLLQPKRPAATLLPEDHQPSRKIIKVHQASIAESESRAECSPALPPTAQMSQLQGQSEAPTQRDDGAACVDRQEASIASSRVGRQGVAIVAVLLLLVLLLVGFILVKWGGADASDDLSVIDPRFALFNVPWQWPGFRTRYHY